MTGSKPSKSELKRRTLALQELGEKLIELDAQVLESLPLPDELRKAVLDAASMKSRGALRRQKQWIGKLMRTIDPDPIRAELARLAADDIHAKRLFAHAERWRDRIVREGKDAFDAFTTEAGVADAELERLLSELGACVDERSEKTVRRKIFRRVHEILGKIPK